MLELQSLTADAEQGNAPQKLQTLSSCMPYKNCTIIVASHTPFTTCGLHGRSMGPLADVIVIGWRALRCAYLGCNAWVRQQM